MRAMYEFYPMQSSQPLNGRGSRRAVVTWAPFGDYIEHDDGTRTPAEFSYNEEVDGVIYVVECIHDGEQHPRAIAVHVTPPEDRGLRTADLSRARNLQDAVEDAWLAITRPPAEPADLKAIERPYGLTAGMLDTVRTLTKQQRRRVTNALLRRVAQIYVENEPTGAPTLAVKEELSIGASTASRYVKLAREAGFLQARGDG